MVIPVLQFAKDPPGFFFWMSKTRVPVAFDAATTIVKTVPTVPEGGDAFTGTEMVPTMPEAWWNEQ